MVLWVTVKLICRVTLVVMAFRLERKGETDGLQLANVSSVAQLISDLTFFAQLKKWMSMKMCMKKFKEIRNILLIGNEIFFWKTMRPGVLSICEHMS